MYVLHDVKVKYGDLTAQIDYIVITSVFIYFIECKNLIGNITVNEEKTLLYTSIPYDEGWKIKVDGQDVEYKDYLYFGINVVHKCILLF